MENKSELSIKKIKRYGWIPDHPDHRDLIYKAIRPSFFSRLPPMVDLRPNCPPIYDQSSLGSCTGNAIAAALEFNQMKQKETPFTPSRLFIYYNEREIEGTVDQDAGASIRDGIKSVASLGAPPENPDWPYDIEKFAQKPSDIAYKDALRYKSLLYHRIIPTLYNLKNCLAYGYPFVCGISIYESFESDEVAKTGIVPMPKQEESNLGGHAILGCGFKDSDKSFIMRNSWGTDWGIKGTFLLPYAYLTDPNLADDFWVIKQVS